MILFVFVRVVVWWRVAIVVPIGILVSVHRWSLDCIVYSFDLFVCRVVVYRDWGEGNGK